VVGWGWTHDRRGEGWVGRGSGICAIGVGEGEFIFIGPINYWHTAQLCKFSYAVKNSSTILLPQWFLTLKDLKLSEHIMPWDVTTRWNSTFNMLDFAIEYRKALQLTTSDLNLNLRQYELSREEWALARQLRDVLKVCNIYRVSTGLIIYN
jgi:hypothetical protein